MSSDEEDLDLNDEAISQIDNNSDDGEAMDTEGKVQKTGKLSDDTRRDRGVPSILTL